MPREDYWSRRLARTDVSLAFFGVLARCTRELVEKNAHLTWRASGSDGPTFAGFAAVNLCMLSAMRLQWSSLTA